MCRALFVNMAFKAFSFVKREPLVVKCKIWKNNRWPKKEREKLMKVNHTFCHFEWIVTNFVSKLNFQVQVLDLHKNLNSFPTYEEMVYVFKKYITKWLKGVNEQASRLVWMWQTSEVVHQRVCTCSYQQRLPCHFPMWLVGWTQ